MVLTQLFFDGLVLVVDSFVSIPLWFLRNTCFIWWCSICCGSVSIPLWFLRNAWVQEAPAARDTRFHTTMVLTQPWYLIFISLQESCFHTTMVLTQHFIAGLNYTIPLRFPYHYGSYATGTQLRRKNSCVDVSIPLWFLRNPDLLEGSWPDSLSVSIPLWFLRNRFYYKDIIQVLGRQNQPNGKIP